MKHEAEVDLVFDGGWTGGWRGRLTKRTDLRTGRPVPLILGIDQTEVLILECKQYGSLTHLALTMWSITAINIADNTIDQLVHGGPWRAPIVLSSIATIV